MLKARILKTRISFFSKDESSGLRHITVACKDRPNEYMLAGLGILRRGCRCSHDCCGHVQHATPRVERRNKRNEWYVTQHWYYNV